MSTCSPQQIEEKKRMALEKLKARKINANFIHNSPMKTNTSNHQLAKPTNTVSSPKTTDFYGRFESNKALTKPTSAIVNRINNNSKADMVRQGGGPIAQNYSKPTCEPYTKTGYKQEMRPMAAGAFFNKKEPITGVTYMILHDRFVIEPSKYFEPLITTFKTIPSRLYDVHSKLWNFHIKDYELTMEKVQLLRPDVVIGTIPLCVLKCVREPKLDYNSIEITKIEPTLLDTLMPFQKEAVCFGISKKGRCLLGDEMGLGKTFQALGIANYYKDDWPLLIATTSSMRNNWEEKIQKYIPSVPLHYIQHMQTGKDYINEARVLITSHDMMSRCTDKLLERGFGVIIMDESHILKNFKTKCTKAAASLAKKARRVILLTGTPVLSRPNELYSQIILIDDRFFTDYFEFSRRYCNGHSSRFGWDSSGQSNLQELEIVLNKRFMIRRTKENVLELPDKSREIVKLNSALLKLTVEDQKNLNIMVTNYDKTRANEKHAALLSFFSETAKLKIKAVCSYVCQLVEEKRKFLVFAHHQVMINKICEILSRKNVSYIKIDGRTNSDQRNFLVERFNRDEKYICAVLSITAANAGITLTAAQIVLFAELHWNPSILSQAESRAHRIGQVNKVEVRYLLAEGTADDYMWKIIQSKTDVLNEAGLSKDSFKDTASSKQIVDASVLPQSQKNIRDYFNTSMSEDTSIKEFSFEDDDDDEELANIALDF